MYQQSSTLTIPIFTIGEMRKMAKRQLKGKWLKLFPILLIYTIITVFPALIIQIRNYALNIQTLTQTFGEMNTGFDTSSLPAGFMDAMTATASHLSIPAQICWFLLLAVTGPLNISLAAISLKVLRNEPFSISTLFEGFHRFGKAFFAYILISIFSTLWTIAFLVPGAMIMIATLTSSSSIVSYIGIFIFLAVIIAAFIFLLRYEMTYFIMADDERCAALSAVRRSVKMMHGHLRNYFILRLSFLPCFLLLCVPIFIAIIALSAVITADNASSAAITLCAIIMAVAAVVVFIGSLFLTIYMQTSAAVFYSGASGNFRMTNDTASSAENGIGHEIGTDSEKTIALDELQTTQTKQFADNESGKSGTWQSTGSDPSYDTLSDNSPAYNQSDENTTNSNSSNFKHPTDLPLDDGAPNGNPQDFKASTDLPPDGGTSNDNPQDFKASADLPNNDTAANTDPAIDADPIIDLLENDNSLDQLDSDEHF